ncbi:hypothetical protein TBLA_0B08820 [Henningerozyma blattae CBS 6284]|uniref:Pyruvate decarboxylase n=1 Tax=Henningerozyma blattae (strain ATCC 34711 / CBS 6284 / DSM 70876 / NBRC 10599 / NRRL Y-10934 / UCD 77-7) TaxID=1071380 RepID=I2GZZ6_HENB6|nr:hypothetical protein TBLA_0B08820 [Tetrapisispora blattae CBS 6284]CCH59698.1 hypothetical protein TBLA_0B08820 [Tetrapisispora blattae CBS 6284]
MDYTRMYSLPNDITLADYLFHRLNQFKIHTVFGLPGEFNMPLIDKLLTIPDLKWAGNANELNAAYAADGYARIKGIGCLLTTFGVGELSSINGIAGSYAEHVGVLHIIGMPPSSIQTSQLLLHHTLGNGDYTVFHRIASELACYSTVLNDTDYLTKEIDLSIVKAWTLQRPVYLGIPMNFISYPIKSNLLNKDLDFTLESNNEISQDDVIELILKNIYRCKKPVIVVDACVTRHNIEKETEELFRRTKFPVLVTPMAKGSVDESLPEFAGVFCGSISSPQVREVLDSVDLLLVIGCTLPEFTTSSFHFSYKSKHCIFIFSDYIKYRNTTFADLNIKQLIKKLLLALDVSKIKNFQLQENNNGNIYIPNIKLNPTLLLRQEWVWNQLSHWFQDGDIIITETGTTAFGINQTKFPHNARGISQSLWGSTGYSLGACLGASFALSEIRKEQQVINNITQNVFPLFKDPPKHRVILFIGDGAFQLTVQELSTIIRWGLTPYIFIMNNHGYSGDRFLHHRSDAGYYDIPQWDYLGLLEVFGAKIYESKKIITVGDFEKMVNNPNFAIDSVLRMIEIVLPPMDVPQALMDKWRLEQEEEKKKVDHNQPMDWDSTTPGSTISTQTVNSTPSSDEQETPSPTP